MKKKGNAVSVKEDLSKFLNFYNKSTYMGVAKTMGQKLQYKLYGRGNKLSMEELIPKDCFITPQTVRLNQLKERMQQINGSKYSAHINKQNPQYNIRMEDFPMSSPQS